MLFPVVEREMRVAARSRSACLTRFVAALFAIGIWSVTLLLNRGLPANSLGPEILNAFSVCAFGFCLLSGVFLTADCLSEEKREGTLGLLFLTQLRAWQVVLGKFIANSAVSFFAILAASPVLMLTLLAGGVTAAEVLRLSLVFLTTLFFSLSAGLLASAGTGMAGLALTRGLVLIAVLAGVPPLLHWVLASSTIRPWVELLLLPSPGYTLYMAFEANYRAGLGASGFWSSEAVVAGVGLIFLAGSWSLVRHSWKRDESAPGGKKPTATTGPSKLLDDDPAQWVCARDLAPSRLAVRALLIPLLIWFPALLISISPWTTRHIPFYCTALFSAFAAHIFVKITLAIGASHYPYECGRSGAWELLCVTLVPPSAILEGHRKSLTRQFRNVRVALIIMNLAMLAAAMFCPKELEIAESDKSMFQILFLGGIICLFVDFPTLIWVGTWHGLSARRHHHAILLSLAKVMLANWLAIVFLWLGLNSLPIGTRITPQEVLLAWFFLAGVIDLAMTLHARRQINRVLQSSVAPIGPTFG